MSTKKTGWEALDKWVGDGASAVKKEGEATATAGKTGWEALEKWVGPGGAATEPGAAGSAAPAGDTSSSGGGFMGWLKRLFGGK